MGERLPEADPKKIRKMLEGLDDTEFTSDEHARLGQYFERKKEEKGQEREDKQIKNEQELRLKQAVRYVDLKCKLPFRSPSENFVGTTKIYERLFEMPIVSKDPKQWREGDLEWCRQKLEEMMKLAEELDGSGYKLDPMRVSPEAWEKWNTIYRFISDEFEEKIPQGDLFRGAQYLYEQMLEKANKPSAEELERKRNLLHVMLLDAWRVDTDRLGFPRPHFWLRLHDMPDDSLDEQFAHAVKVGPVGFIG